MSIIGFQRELKICIEFKVKENVTSYALHSSIDLLRGDDSRLNLMKVPVNGCQLGKLGTIANSMLGVFFKEMRRISNLPLRCPLYANKLYYLTNYTINPDSFPPITIPMQWILTLRILQKQNYVGTLYFHGKFYII
ncbi:uncharacterized protein LOC120782854 [Bactrocera tryoni]|uniref:uncharacterized protein LOC120782854 n=1 Tax=Bactrocera tryoni TaxID=59916 RepID=UPI001A9612B9|nr:uncharacterized protein LOC120782854 [Bactrocera tryoni]